MFWRLAYGCPVASAAYAHHPGLSWLRTVPGGREWLATLDRLVCECVELWDLDLAEPFPYACASLALKAALPDGTPAVLKVQFPDREGEHEADALDRWCGYGAVMLLGHDRDRRALLLERCLPGTALADTALGAARTDRALDVLAGFVRQLAVPAGAPFHTLSEEAARWAATLERNWRAAGRPYERRLLDAALSYLDDLPASQGEQVLLHQDLHAGNVLRAERSPWLVIDPKPLVGELEFAAAPIVRGAELGHSEFLVHRRLDRVVEELGLDPGRAIGWTVAQTLAWAVGGPADVFAGHVEVARWLLARR